MRDKFIALEQEKCEFVYLLARATGATNIVEAGTSFGVSTIYLALAVGQNVAIKAEGAEVRVGKGGKVTAIEKEPEKAEKARAHWESAGEEVAGWVTLLDGDLWETVPAELGRFGEKVGFGVD
jgi:predicted O-methyltransferase YrrM